jgi:hypothetical protein
MRVILAARGLNFLKILPALLPLFVLRQSQPSAKDQENKRIKRAGHLAPNAYDRAARRAWIGSEDYP